MAQFKHESKAEQRAKRFAKLGLVFYLLAFAVILVSAFTGDRLTRFEAAVIFVIGVVLFQLHKIWSKFVDLETQLVEIRNEAKQYRPPPKQREEFTRRGMPEDS